MAGLTASIRSSVRSSPSWDEQSKTRCLRLEESPLVQRISFSGSAILHRKVDYGVRFADSACEMRTVPSSAGQEVSPVLVCHSERSEVEGFGRAESKNPYHCKKLSSAFLETIGFFRLRDPPRRVAPLRMTVGGGSRRKSCERMFLWL